MVKNISLPCEIPSTQSGATKITFSIAPFQTYHQPASE